MGHTPSRPANVPRTRIPSGFSTGTGFDLGLKREKTGSFVLAPAAPWKVAIWPPVLGLLIALFEPVRIIVWRVVTLGNPAFNDPFFVNAFLWQALAIGVAFGGMLLFFHWFGNRWTPRTRFDIGQNQIRREPLEYRFLGIRGRFDAVTLKASETRAIQLCYGGSIQGDSDSPSYDWWQLLIVGPGDPPFRAVLGQGGDRSAMTRVGKEIAAAFSIAWIDDGDYREPTADADWLDGGRLDDGVLVAAGSTADIVDPDAERAVRREVTRRKPLDYVAGILVLFIVAGGAWLFWTIHSMEEMDRVANAPQPPVPGSFLTVELTKLLANGENYRARRIKTTGYVRFVTFLMHHQGKDRHVTYYALSPEPVDLAKRIKGGTIGETAVTNLLIKTEWLDASFSQGSDTNITPKRTVIGLFNVSENRHHLSLISWEAEPQSTEETR